MTIEISKTGFHVVNAAWGNDKLTVQKEGYQVIIGAPVASVVVHKLGYTVVLAPTLGVKFANLNPYLVIERAPQVRVSGLNAYAVFRPTPPPPRKTVVIIGPGKFFGGSGKTINLVGVVEQANNVGGRMPLPVTMAGAIAQESMVAADLYVDNAVEDIFLQGAITQTGTITGKVVIPHVLSASIVQGNDTSANLTVIDNTVDHFLLGSLVQGSAFEADLTVEPSAPVMARYWRMLVSAVAGDSGIDVTDVQFRIDGVDQTTPENAVAAASSSSFYALENLNPSKAFDADEATRWASDFSGTWPQWLQWDFGEGYSRPINGVAFTAPMGSRAPRNFIMQYSANGVDWIDAVSITDSPNTSATVEHNFTAPNVPFKNPTVSHELEGSITQDALMYALMTTSTGPVSTPQFGLRYQGFNHQSRNTSNRPLQSRTRQHVGTGGYHGLDGTEGVAMGWSNNASRFLTPESVDQTLIFGSRFLQRATSTSLRPRFTVVDEAGTLIFEIYLSPSGNDLYYYLWNGVSPGVTASVPMTGTGVALNTWGWLSAHVVRHPTAGKIKIAVNGVTLVNLSNIKTDGAGRMAAIALWTASTTGNVPYYDNLVMTDGLGGAPFNDVLPQMKVATLYPNRTISNEWTLSTGTTAHTLLDEQYVDTTDYVEGTVANKSLVLGFQPFPTSLGTPLAAQAVVSGWNVTGNNSMKLEISNAGAAAKEETRSYPMVLGNAGEWDAMRVLAPNEWGDTLANMQAKLSTLPAATGPRVGQVVVEVLHLV